jgi:hypothetical protein
VLSVVVQALGGQDVVAASGVGRAWRNAARRRVRRLKGVLPTSIAAALKVFPNATDIQIEGPGPVAGLQPGATASDTGGQWQCVLMGQRRRFLLERFLAAPAEARHVRRLRIKDVDAVEVLGEAAAIAAKTRAAAGGSSGGWTLSVRQLEVRGAPVTPRSLQLLSEGLSALEELNIHQDHWQPVYSAPMAAHTLPALRRLELRGSGGEIVRCWEPLPLAAFAPSLEHLVLAGFRLRHTVDLAGLTGLQVRKLVLWGGSFARCVSVVVLAL